MKLLDFSGKYIAFNCLHKLKFSSMCICLSFSHRWKASINIGTILQACGIFTSLKIHSRALDAFCLETPHDYRIATAFFCKPCYSYKRCKYGVCRVVLHAGDEWSSMQLSILAYHPCHNNIERPHYTLFTHLRYVD